MRVNLRRNCVHESFVGILIAIREEVKKTQPSGSSSNQETNNEHSESSLHSRIYMFHLYCQEPTRKQTKKELKVLRIYAADSKELRELTIHSHCKEQWEKAGILSPRTWSPGIHWNLVTLLNR